MSEAITPTLDPAIELIDEQVAMLNADIQANTRRVELDTAVRDRLLAVRATLARKARPRKPRATTDLRAANDEAAEVPAEAATIVPFMAG